MNSSDNFFGTLSYNFSEFLNLKGLQANFSSISSDIFFFKES
jgi:hypothetical protein